MMLVPAVHGRVVRLFLHRSMWYIASNQRVEPLTTAVAQTARHPSSALGSTFASCLERHYASSVAKFVGELNPPGLCWFFAMFPERLGLLFLGTCPVLTLSALRSGSIHHLDLSFRVHAFLPPAVPLLPDTMPQSSQSRMYRERLHSLYTMDYTDLYDGLFVANTQTMFAVGRVPSPLPERERGRAGPRGCATPPSCSSRRC